MGEVPLYSVSSERTRVLVLSLWCRKNLYCTGDCHQLVAVRGSIFISQKMFIKLFCISQFPHKSVSLFSVFTFPHKSINLFYVLANMKNNLKDFWGS
jgi:hypothetical protein